MGANSAMKLKRIFDVTLDVLVWVSAILLTLIVLSVAIEVFLRSALNRPQAWVLEFSEYALLFITFLVAALLVKSERNITVDIVIGLMNKKTRLFLPISNSVSPAYPGHTGRCTSCALPALTASGP